MQLLEIYLSKFQENFTWSRLDCLHANTRDLLKTCGRLEEFLFELKMNVDDKENEELRQMEIFLDDSD